MRLAKKNASLLKTTFLLVCFLWSFRISLASAPVAPLTFSFESWTYENVIFPYRKAVIATGSGQATPILVVYLHGGPKRGNDNVRQMQEQAIFTLPCDFYGGYRLSIYKDGLMAALTFGEIVGNGLHRQMPMACISSKGAVGIPTVTIAAVRNPMW